MAIDVVEPTGPWSAMTLEAAVTDLALVPRVVQGDVVRCRDCLVSHCSSIVVAVADCSSIVAVVVVADCSSIVAVVVVADCCSSIVVVVVVVADCSSIVGCSFVVDAVAVCNFVVAADCCNSTAERYYIALVPVVDERILNCTWVVHNWAC